MVCFGEARREFQRILKTDGWLVLLWNERVDTGTPFLEAYERLLEPYGTDYRDVRKKNNEDPERPANFFGAAGCGVRKFANEQHFNFEGLKGRLLSASYAPGPTHHDHKPMLEELNKIFLQHAVSNSVTMSYETTLYCGHLT